MVKILVVAPLEKPYVKEIENSLKAMQDIVGGYIESVGLEDEDYVSIICNEEGKLDGLPPNRRFYDDIICGTFFISRIDDEGETISLTDEDIQKYTEQFALYSNKFPPVIGMSRRW
jgi:hypothetical protein